MEKTKIVMEPGVRYRGSAWINEFGEIHFCPEQKGTRPTNMKIVYTEGDTTIYESRKFYRVSVQVPKQSGMMQVLLNKVSNAALILARYFNRK